MVYPSPISLSHVYHLLVASYFDQAKHFTVEHVFSLIVFSSNQAFMRALALEQQKCVSDGMQNKTLEMATLAYIMVMPSAMQLTLRLTSLASCKPNSKPCRTSSVHRFLKNQFGTMQKQLGALDSQNLEAFVTTQVLMHSSR